jgi:hypothetical protein
MKYMGGQALYFDWPCRIRRTPMSVARVKVFATAAGIYVNMADGGAKALTYRVSGSYLFLAAVSLWLHLNMIY